MVPPKSPNMACSHIYCVAAIIGPATSLRERSFKMAYEDCMSRQHCRGRGAQLQRRLQAEARLGRTPEAGTRSLDTRTKQKKESNQMIDRSCKGQTARGTRPSRTKRSTLLQKGESTKQSTTKSRDSNPRPLGWEAKREEREAPSSEENGWWYANHRIIH